jgi:hypothetical protein
MEKEMFNTVIKEIENIYNDKSKAVEQIFIINYKQCKRQNQLITNHLIDKLELDEPLKMFTCWGVINTYQDFDNDLLTFTFHPVRRVFKNDIYKLKIDVLRIIPYKYTIKDLKDYCLNNGIKPKSKWSKKDYIVSLIKI